MNQPDSKQRSGGASTKELFIIALIFSAGIILRLTSLASRSLWLDEYTSIEIAQKSILSIITGNGFDSHTPPVYYLLLNAWFSYLPHNAVGLRTFSVLFDAFNLILVYRVFAGQFGIRKGMLSMLFYALSAFAIYYAQEGRMYTLLVFEVLITYDLALRFIQKKISKGWLLVSLTIFATIGMYTHYYYALSLLGISLAVFVSNIKKPLTFFPWLAALFLTAINFIPWILVVLNLIKSGGQHFRHFTWSVIPYTFFRFVAGYAVLPLTPKLKKDFSSGLLQHITLPLIFGIVFTISGICALYFFYNSKVKNRLILLYPLIIPPLCALLISLKVPMLSERYLIVCLPFFIALYAHAPWGSNSPLFWKTIKYLALSLYIFGCLMHYLNPNFGNTQWKETGAYIKQSTKDISTAVVIVSPGYALGVLKYYLPDANNLLPLSQDRKTEMELNDIGASLGVKHLEQFWLIERGTVQTKQHEVEKLGYKLADKKVFPLENGVRVLHFRGNVTLLPKTISSSPESA